MSKYKVLFQLTGSIASFKACSLISMLVKNNFDVQVICSPSVFEFIGPATLEGLTGKPVLSHSFEKGQMMAHIEWARWADLILLCPATANTVNALAAGTGTGLIGDVFLANNFLKPYWIVPAMNSQMYQHPATQKSMATLKSWGANILETATGDLACGEYGDGRMLEAIDIFSKIESYFNGGSTNKGQNKNLKVLVTAGGTSEPIDGVRSLSNFSTGETGKQIADYLLQNNIDVYYVHSITAPIPPQSQNNFTFKTADDLERILKDLLKKNNFDYVIHAAAVSDFIVDKLSDKKISSRDPVTLTLKPRPKIIDSIKTFSKSKKIKVIGFKLTNTKNKKQIREQILKLSFNPAIDFVVHNDLSGITKTQHTNELYKKDKIVFKSKTKQDLAKNLFQLMRGQL